METKLKRPRYSLIQTTGFYDMEFEFIVKEIRKLYPKTRIYEPNSSSHEFNCVDDFGTRIIVNRNIKKFTMKCSNITMEQYKELSFLSNKKIESITYQDRIKISLDVYDESIDSMCYDYSKTIKLAVMFNKSGYDLYSRGVLIETIKKYIKDKKLNVDIDIKATVKAERMKSLLLKASKKQDDYFVTVLLYTGGTISMMSNSVEEIKKLKEKMKETLN